MTLESCSASTLSLEPNCASLSASLTMTGRPVSSTRRTMLSEMAPVVSVIASRFTLRDARMTGFARAAVGRAPTPASSRSRMRPFSAPGDLDDRVEHGLEELVELPLRHQLLAEVEELADAGELEIGRRRAGRRGARRRGPRPVVARRARAGGLVEHAERELGVAEP